MTMDLVKDVRAALVGVVLYLAAVSLLAVVKGATEALGGRP